MSKTFAEKLAEEDARRLADLARRKADAEARRKMLEETGELPVESDDGDE